MARDPTTSNFKIVFLSENFSIFIRYSIECYSYLNYIIIGLDNDLAPYRCQAIV